MSKIADVVDKIDLAMGLTNKIGKGKQEKPTLWPCRFYPVILTMLSHSNFLEASIHSV